jgi:hypothetical protein
MDHLRCAAASGFEYAPFMILPPAGFPLQGTFAMRGINRIKKTFFGKSFFLELPNQRENRKAIPARKADF